MKYADRKKKSSSKNVQESIFVAKITNTFWNVQKWEKKKKAFLNKKVAPSVRAKSDVTQWVLIRLPFFPHFLVGFVETQMTGGRKMWKVHVFIKIKSKNVFLRVFEKSTRHELEKTKLSIASRIGLVNSYYKLWKVWKSDENSRR